MIYSALYYPYSFARGDRGVREGRFHPGKYAETLPVWMGYIRRCYPDEPITFFADVASPIHVRPLLEQYLMEPWSEEGEDIPWALYDADGSGNPPRVHVRWFSIHSEQFATTCTHFRPMQRNIVKSLCMAYERNESWFWLDNDAFLNTDIRPLVADCDAAAPQIAHHQMTMDSVCTYISAARLHTLDSLGIDLPSFLLNMLANGPTETRMSTLQEGGLYKLFAYGKTRSFGADIQLAHLNCYHRFMAFIERNPLPDCPAYNELRWTLASLDVSRYTEGELSFLDMLYPENATDPLTQ